nr:high mobility group B protein 7-like isoform X2 [Populus alba]
MTRKRGDAEPTDGYANTAAASLVRAKDGNGFVKCGECEEDVPVALISFHGCSLDGREEKNGCICIWQRSKWGFSYSSHRGRSQISVHGLGQPP